MSSCPRYGHEEKSCERTAISALESTTCRDLSSRGPLKTCVSGSIPHWMKIWIAFVILIGSAMFIQGYNPYQSRGLDLALLDEEGKDPGRGRRWILSTCIYGLAKLVSAATEQNKILKNIRVRGSQTLGKLQDCTDTAGQAWVASLFGTLDIIRLLEDPPPQLYLVACLCFAFGIAALQQLYKADVYLNRVLVLGWMVGCVAAFQAADVLMGLKNYLASCLILALLLSAFFHCAMRLWKGSHTLDNRQEVEVLPCEKSCFRRERQGDFVMKASQR
jgi:hypothetical protein